MEKDQTKKYKGYTLKLMNINWTDHLDQAWQCNWTITPYKIEISYGRTPKEAFENMKKKIDLAL